MKLASRYISGIRKPAVAGLTVVFGLSAYAVVNAVFLQGAKHPASLFSMRDGAGGDRALRPDERFAGTPALMSDERNITRILLNELPGTRIDRKAGDVTQSEGSAKRILPPPTTATRSPTGSADKDGQIIYDLADLQQLLKELGFYSGEVDGELGPLTESAIAQYKLGAGLQGIDLTLGQLVTSARNNLMVTAAIPSQRPDGISGTRVETVLFRPETPVSDAPSAQDVVVKVQEALRQFAGNHIVVDGIAGSQTRDAISEFQAVFRMEVTGEIDDTLLAKMRSVGLIDG